MNDIPIYDSATRKPPAIEELLEAYRYRHLIAAFVKRDIVTRYKRSVLGVVWTMLNPLLTMAIMVIVFSSLFDQTPKYPIYVLTGLIAWNFFSQVTTAAPQTLMWSGPLIHKVYLPRTVFALVALGGGIVNLVLSLVPLILLMLLLGVPIAPPLVVVPLAIVPLAAFSLGLGLLLSAATVYFPDTIDIYAIVAMAWLYVSAIFYPYDIIPPEYRWWFFNLNPMYHLILLFRDPLYYSNWPSLGHIAAAVSVATVTLVVGWLTFTRKADELAYRI